MAGKWSHRRRRIMASGSPILLAGGAALIAAAGAIQKEFGVEARIVEIVGFVGLLLLLLQWHAEFRRRTYDPTWIIKFSDRFDSKEMELIRSKAARRLKEDVNELSREKYSAADIDDVLDFFEDLGFYMQGDQITPEVTHHNFHYWLRGYYCATEPYIKNKQKEKPSQWEFVEQLFKTVHEVEVERSGSKAVQFLNIIDLGIFLDEEINLATAKKERPARSRA